APGAGNEIQLTDAMKTLTMTKGMMAVDFDGTRYDMGNKLGVMMAQVETALKHPEIGVEFREYLKSIAASL
ncbi:MAG: UTP--glucose-1-phosphate uridylyltransferase, partial [Oscillospiraceae bacterium]|nr:UTP--glucose-1-phosphate uridylyltransferase [Oscillospiraceae bacterium]